MAGIADPESVAEHSFRTALLGYVLASLEGADPMKTATMCLFHDTPEARFNDVHKLAQRYLDVEASGQQAHAEQVERLPAKIAAHVVSLLNEYSEKQSPEAHIAHDADRLECLFQAREYQVQGYVQVQEWIDDCRTGLNTSSARSLAEACLHIEPRQWWQGLKKLLR